MTWPLIALAVLSFAGGWIGIPALWGGADRLNHFLAPAFQLAAPEAAHAVVHSASTEIALTLVSLLVSLAGIALAYLFYLRRPELAPAAAARLGALYNLVANKYYVDEAYRFLFVRPLVVGSSEVLWKGVDQGAIDGAVNLAARRTRGLGQVLRRLQSGNIRSYAGWVALGAILLMTFMVVAAA